MSHFGRNIKKLRRLKSMSQTELADLIGLKRGALGAYEEGRSEPKVETIIHTANYFSIPIDGLLTRELSINELLNFNTDLTTDESQLRKVYPKIPFITKSNYSDYLAYYNKDNFISKMPYMEWPVDDSSKTYRFYEITDLEMSNNQGGLYPKDIILLEKLNLDHLVHSAKALVLYDDLKFRNIQVEDDLVLLKADHPMIEDISVSISEIKEVWGLVGIYQKFRHKN